MKLNFTYPAMALLVTIGCGGPANKYDAVVSGSVTIDGELAKSGTVVFHPVARDGKVAIGRIYPDGSYSLRTGQGDLREEDGGTVVPGEYIATVSITGPPVESEQVIPGAPPIPGPSLVAAKYAATDTSDLRRTVKAGEQIINLELRACGSASARRCGKQGRGRDGPCHRFASGGAGGESVDPGIARRFGSGGCAGDR